MTSASTSTLTDSSSSLSKLDLARRSSSSRSIHIPPLDTTRSSTHGYMPPAHALPPIMRIHPLPGSANILKGALGFGNCKLEGMVELKLYQPLRAGALNVRIAAQETRIPRWIQALKELKTVLGGKKKRPSVSEDVETNMCIWEKNNGGVRVLAEQRLWKGDSDVGGHFCILDPGKYVFPFTVDNLPKDLPGTLHGDLASITYKIYATLTYVKQPYTPLTRLVVEHEIPMPRFPPRALCPPEPECIVTRSAPPITYTLIVPTTVVGLHSSLPILLHLSHVAPGYRVSGLTARILQYAECRTRNDSIITRRTEICRLKDVQTVNGEYFRKQVVLMIRNPRSARPSYRSRYVNIRHELVVELRFKRENRQRDDRDDPRQPSSHEEATGSSVVERIPLCLHGLSEEALDFLTAYVTHPEDPINLHCLGLITYKVKK
ncbi:hypothetical protein BC832DRAFT_473211 [Gaertneriomyces semiglobifer]|nr:hypothetical protein BC832DRAFT_473211 [Gaertneriomyces semiglobifer]